MDKRQEEMKDRLKKALDMAEKKPVDLARDLNIPKSAISQYLSGSSKNMPSQRMYAICKYLNVSEAWLMGYNVAIERPLEQKETDELVDLVERLKKDKDFRSLVIKLDKLPLVKIEGLIKLLGIPLD